MNSPKRQRICIDFRWFMKIFHVNQSITSNENPLRYFIWSVFVLLKTCAQVGVLYAQILAARIHTNQQIKCNLEKSIDRKNFKNYVSKQKSVYICVYMYMCSMSAMRFPIRECTVCAVTIYIPNSYIPRWENVNRKRLRVFFKRICYIIILYKWFKKMKWQSTLGYMRTGQQTKSMQSKRYYFFALYHLQKKTVAP